ncbi:histidine phosphatase family protein [Frateuria aurantia]
MRILMARHGQTEWNLAGRIQGSEDSPLTALGVEQAQAIGQAWKHSGIRTIYSSPLGRAMDTARHAAAGLGASCLDDGGLVERAFGRYEGVPITALREMDPQWEAIILGTRPELAAPDGESLQQVAARVETAVRRLAEASDETTLGIVSHGHCLLGLVWRLSGEPADIRQFHHRNASYSELEWQDGELRVVRWAVADHLVGDESGLSAPARFAAR